MPSMILPSSAATVTFLNRTARLPTLFSKILVGCMARSKLFCYSAASRDPPNLTCIHTDRRRYCCNDPYGMSRGQSGHPAGSGAEHCATTVLLLWTAAVGGRYKREYLQAVLLPKHLLKDASERSFPSKDVGRASVDALWW